MLSRFHLIPERNGQMDRQICYINIARQHTALLTRDKNEEETTTVLRPHFQDNLSEPTILDFLAVPCWLLELSHSHLSLCNY